MTIRRTGGTIVGMYITPLSAPQKVGAVFYGLAAGIGVTLATSLALGLLGLTVTLFAQYTGWIHLGEIQSWLPIVGLEQGFLLGIVLGAVVCWRVWRARLGAVPTQ